MSALFSPAELATWLASRTPKQLTRGRAASVLIPLLFTSDDISVLFMKRPEDTTLHSGQVSFPGGSREPSDSDEAAAAKREAFEELGIEPANVNVLGRLDDMFTVSNFNITPVVGQLVDAPVVNPSRVEVADWFWVSLRALADETQWRCEQLPWRGEMHETWFFDGAKHLIWGATARIVRDLLEIIREKT